MMSDSVLARLADVVQQRFDNRPAASYTTDLFEAGHDTIAAKIIEEAYELIATAADEGPANGADVIHEAADLVYHLLVFTTAAGIAWSDVERELERRFGVSGLPARSSPS